MVTIVKESGKLAKIKILMETKFPVAYDKYYMQSVSRVFDLFHNGAVRKGIANDLNKKPFLFSEICIETLNRCNGTCSFCPVNVNSNPLPKKVMSEELFRSIIEQLQELNYSGQVCLSGNNEPLIDTRIISFVRYAREKLPNAHIVMYTNGSLLDDNKIKILLLLLDELYIDNYSPSYTNATKKALAFIELYPEYSNKLFINMTRVDAKRTTRAGQANNRLPVDFIKSPCIYPFHQLMVRSDGKVSQCCNDALALTAMGDLTNQTIMEVWNGEPFQKMRENMLNGRHCISTCSGCDVLLVYPDILKKIRSILKSSDGSMVEK